MAIGPPAADHILVPVPVRNTPWLRVLGAAALAGLLAAAYTPLSDLLARWAEVPPRIERADAVVVLGASVGSTGMLSSVSLRRTVHGVRLYQQGYAPLLVLAGVPARDGFPDEARVRARLARDLGVPPPAIVTATALTTREEAVRVRSLAAARPIRTVLLVTESRHLRRARAIFERAGFEVFPAPTDAARRGDDAAERLGLTWSVLRELAAGLYNRANGPD